ncbi:CoA transferase subunit A [Salisediminibacterium selenitireducens]|uniref:Coenzyme A transferase n=1 Tax=Bacillus selenitireducens (strain ATCC 700615 / DSM 15326 / MLS10) TaxID=439292 RepID=D6Y0M1_BACIE|nr:CoA-transferase [Salisediminibacterium selenitireducens]ADI00589.1 coenzyme A transferase [[Bacillus] selenitireducens MLS10]
MSKRMDLKDAIRTYVKKGDRLCFSGNALHRAPMAAVREIARQRIGSLSVAKTAGALDIDLLCALGLVDTVDAGFVSYESAYGLCTHFRKGVEDGRITGNEHACYTVINALRGATMNVPFVPVHGLMHGDLLVEKDYFKVVEDPFGSGEEVTLVRTIRPDVAVIHVHTADERGNAVIEGAKYEDEIILRAADKVILTAEKVVKTLQNSNGSRPVDIPGFLVDAVVEAPNGAMPTSCEGRYDVNDKMLKQFLEANDTEAIDDWLTALEKQDCRGRGVMNR